MGCGSSVKKEGKRTLKKTEKTVKKAGSDVASAATTAGEQIGKQAKRSSKDLTDLDWYNKVAQAGAASLSDPGAWMTAIPSFGTSFVKSGSDAWEAMSDAERQEARAKTEQELAARQERQATLEQEKMVADKAKAAAASAKERATRLGKGRRGLLYQGKETGVTSKSNVLGG